MSKLVPTMLAIAAMTLGAAAHAQTSPSPRPSQAPPSAAPAQPVQPGGRTVTEAELRKELEKLGFKNVRDIKQKGSTIEAKAMKDGKRVSLNIDANTGKVTAR
jgi:predicted RNA binding protein YcfA (HicA-like mRNA interferase family)